MPLSWLWDVSPAPRDFIRAVCLLFGAYGCSAFQPLERRIFWSILTQYALQKEIMITRAGLLVIVFLFLLNFDLQAQHQDSIAVMKAVDKFVTAFNNFDWTTFKGSFTDDASIFYPFWNQARRIQGRRDIETAWMTIFPEFGAPNNTRKLQISPKDVNLQIYGKTALVTFHLGDGATSLSRRTLVMVKKKQIWKIAHLHASSVSSDKN